MAIEKVIKGDAQTKYVNEACRVPNSVFNLSTYTTFTSGITGTGEIYACLPRTSQGSDDHQRVGDVIQPLSCTVHMDITCAATTYPLDRTIHVFMLTSKSVKALDNFTSIPITQLLDQGDGTNTNFDGTSFTSMLPVNHKEFTILKHRKFRLVKAFGQPSNGTTAVTAGTTDGVITPAAHYHHLRFKVKVPKKFTYDSAPSRYPTNYAPFFVVGWTQNTPVDAASSIRDINVLARCEMRYKDM